MAVDSADVDTYIRVCFMSVPFKLPFMVEAAPDNVGFLVDCPAALFGNLTGILITSHSFNFALHSKQWL